MNTEGGDHLKSVDQLKTELSLRENCIALLQATHAQETQTFKVELDSTREEASLLQNDLKVMDKGYHELQRRYYQLRATMNNMRSNEQTIKTSIRNYEKLLIDEQERGKALKSSVQSQTEKAKHELETFESKIDAQLKRKDMELKLLKNEIKKLTTQLEQKTTENAELVTICEQLM